MEQSWEKLNIKTWDILWHLLYDKKAAKKVNMLLRLSRCFKNRVAGKDIESFLKISSLKSNQNSYYLCGNKRIPLIYQTTNQFTVKLHHI